MANTTDKSTDIKYMIDQYGMFLRITDIADILKVNRATVDKLIQTGQLPYGRVTAQYRIRVDDFLKWFDANVKEQQANNLFPRLV